MAEQDTGYSKSRFVLSQVKIENIVRFKNEQKCLNFSKGINLLIGQNHSGKSSLFEAIRRCLSVRHNSSVSSKADDNKTSAVVCKYVCDGAPSKKKILYTFYICRPRPTDADLFLKGCILVTEYADESNYTIDFGLDCMKVSDNKVIESSCEISSYEHHRECTACKKFFESLKTPEEIDFKKLDDWTKHFDDDIKQLDIGSQKNDKTQCERLIKSQLHNQIVITFPMRGIGAVQWTCSNVLEERSQNYSEASKRAEIIFWFLKYCKERDDIEKEKEYYDFLTNEDGGLYELDDSDNILVKKGEKVWSILKQSEGFIEAKICSILLAVGDFGTVILDEPTTGMHKQMVERLGSLIQEKVTEKVVIISTHNQALLKPSVIERLFILRKQKDDPKTSSIYLGSALLKDKKLDNVFPSSISEQQFAGVCFADKVLCVEGPSDQLFLESLLTLMRSNEDHHYSSEDGTCEVGLKKDRPRLAGIYIVSMNTKTNMGNYKRFCTKMGKSSFFMLDKDKGESVNKDGIFTWKVKDLETVFYEIIEEIKESRVDVTDIEHILKSCFTKHHLEINDGKVDSFQRNTKFKLFIHGSEKWEYRIELLRFLFDPCKIKSVATSIPAQELQRIRIFVRDIDSEPPSDGHP